LQPLLAYITNLRYRHIVTIASSSIQLLDSLRMNGTTRLTGVFADVRAKRGEIVGLRMDPAGCHLFPVEP
jgi:uncharacterized protein (DUF2141 family)